MIRMTKCNKYTLEYVVLGCELLNEFRRNGSANCIQQRLVNSDGFTFFSYGDYRGKINPDRVYIVWFYGADEEDDIIPIFGIRTPDRIKYRFVKKDPFPNAEPEIRESYRKEGYEPYTEIGSGLAYNHEYRRYDGCVE